MSGQKDMSLFHRKILLFQSSVKEKLLLRKKMLISRTVVALKIKLTFFVCLFYLKIMFILRTLCFFLRKILYFIYIKERPCLFQNF